MLQAFVDLIEPGFNLVKTRLNPADAVFEAGEPGLNPEAEVIESLVNVVGLVHQGSDQHDGDREDLHPTLKYWVHRHSEGNADAPSTSGLNGGTHREGAAFCDTRVIPGN
jgi:hypothetical protein